LNGNREDAVDRGNSNPTITQDDTQDTQSQPTVISSPTPYAPPAEQQDDSQQPTSAGEASLFALGATSAGAKGPEFDGDGNVTTDSQTKSMRKKQSQPEQREKSARQQLFEKVTTEEIAKNIDGSSNIINNSTESDEVKNIALQYLDKIAVNTDENLEDIDDVLTAIQEQINKVREVANNQ
jgi:hypothetical protein